MEQQKRVEDELGGERERERESILACTKFLYSSSFSLCSSIFEDCCYLNGCRFLTSPSAACQCNVFI